MEWVLDHRCLAPQPEVEPQSSLKRHLERGDPFQVIRGPKPNSASWLPRDKASEGGKIWRILPSLAVQIAEGTGHDRRSPPPRHMPPAYYNLLNWMIFMALLSSELLKSREETTDIGEY